MALCAGTLPLTVGWSLIYLAAGAPLAAAVPGFYSLFTPLNTAVFAWTRNLAFYRFTQLLLILLLPFLVMLALGGYRQSSAVILWAALCPLGSLLVEDLRKTVLWIVGFVVLLVIGALVEPYLAPPGLPDDLVTWFFVLNLGAVVLVVFGLLYYFVGQRNYFQERSEMLLLNILPREISETLKMGPRTIAEQFDEASILFADVVDFTPMAAGMTPLGLVELLNEVFQCFDALVEQYDLEKIKTIGDCYMVAAGVPRRRADHARVLVQLALDMQAAVAAPAVRRPAARLPHRHQFGPGGGGRDRRQEVHLRPVGRIGEPREPHGKPGPGRRHPDHRTHLAPGEGRLRLRGARHHRRQRRRPDPRLACLCWERATPWRIFIANEHCPRAIDALPRPNRP